MNKQNTDALKGICVLEIAHHMAGPVAAQKLGDMGAEVIKIEPPGVGEWTRTRPIADAWVGEYNTSLIALNRNKKSVTLDLKSKKGKEIFKKLVKEADVIVSNYRPTVHERLGTDYETVKSLNPQLIYCSITGYGETGPYEERPGQDLIIQALSGVVWNSGKRDDPPIPLGTFAIDSTAGNLALAGITTALYSREKTGEGQKIEINLLSSALDLQIQEFTTYLNCGIIPERQDEVMGHPFINSPYGIHKTKDSYLALAMAPFDKLSKALDCKELLKFDKWSDGQEYKDEIFRIVGNALKKRTTKEWIELLDSHDVWCGPVNTYEEVEADPQVKYNQTVQTIEDSKYGELKFVANPITFSNTPVSYSMGPPDLGEHNEEVLKSLGYSNENIESLKRENVIQDKPPATYKI